MSMSKCRMCRPGYHCSKCVHYEEAFHYIEEIVELSVLKKALSVK